MDTKYHLRKLRESAEAYRQLTDDYIRANRQWYTWNYWAQPKVWFDDWMEENGLKNSDVRTRKDKSHLVHVEYDREIGAVYFRHRGMLYSQKERAYFAMDQALEMLWKHETPLKLIANNYARHIVHEDPRIQQELRNQATYKRISRSPWFKKRFKTPADALDKRNRLRLVTNN